MEYFGRFGHYKMSPHTQTHVYTHMHRYSADQREDANSMEKTK